jgi:hypothetical protein
MKRSTRSQFIRLLKRLFWIAAGRDDRTVGDGPRRLSDIVKAHDISHEYHEMEGDQLAPLSQGLCAVAIPIEDI